MRSRSQNTVSFRGPTSRTSGQPRRRNCRSRMKAIGPRKSCNTIACMKCRNHEISPTYCQEPIGHKWYLCGILYTFLCCTSNFSPDEAQISSFFYEMGHQRIISPIYNIGLFDILVVSISQSEAPEFGGHRFHAVSMSTPRYTDVFIMPMTRSSKNFVSRLRPCPWRGHGHRFLFRSCS